MVLFNLIYLSKGPFLLVRGGGLAAIAHSVESMKHGSAILRDHSKNWSHVYWGTLHDFCRVHRMWRWDHRRHGPVADA